MTVNVYTINYRKGGVPMPEQSSQSIFRKKTLERISSPDQLTDYLRVTNPGIWAVLIAVILMLAGLLGWSTIGTLETSVDVTVTVTDHKAQVISSGTAQLEAVMPLRLFDHEYTITSAETDAYGRSVGLAQTDLPDGTYKGKAVTETIHPIWFLLESR